MTLRLGARGSALSLAQAALVSEALAARARVDIVTMKTTGDRLSAAGSPIEWKGDFTKELDEALLDGRIDIAVHSLKDVPAELPEGLALAAVPMREDPRDVLVSHPRRSFAELPSDSRIGTSSPRRRAQLLASRSDVDVRDARGNVDTRIRRLHEGRWDAIVLARAGLARLGRLEEVSEIFPESVLLPAPGQGALAIVARREDRETLDLMRGLDHTGSHQEVIAERSFLAALGAGCRAPVAGRARVTDGALLLAGGVFSTDGARVLRGELGGPAEDAQSIGGRLAGDLLERGASALIAETLA
jgi:hydroxymethylbilane synthase